MSNKTKEKRIHVEMFSWMKSNDVQPQGLTDGRGITKNHCQRCQSTRCSSLYTYTRHRIFLTSHTSKLLYIPDVPKLYLFTRYKRLELFIPPLYPLLNGFFSLLLKKFGWRKEGEGKDHYPAWDPDIVPRLRRLSLISLLRSTSSISSRRDIIMWWQHI